MDKELKKRWIEALSSGYYTKGYGALQCQGKFCCLGVLADLLNVTNIDSSSYVNAKEYIFDGGFKSMTFLDANLMNNIGLNVSDALHLTVINDSTDGFLDAIDYIKRDDV